MPKFKWKNLLRKLREERAKPKQYVCDYMWPITPCDASPGVIVSRQNCVSESNIYIYNLELWTDREKMSVCRTNITLDCDVSRLVPSSFTLNRNPKPEATGHRIRLYLYLYLSFRVYFVLFSIRCTLIFQVNFVFFIDIVRVLCIRVKTHRNLHGSSQQLR